MTVTALAAETLNDLLREEIAAVETYVQAIPKFQGSDRETLAQIKKDHIEACNLLREYIHGQSGGPDHRSGAWGVWRKLVEGTAKAFGKGAALRALMEGEDRCIRGYQKVLENRHLPIEIKEGILSLLIPRGRHRAAVLEQRVARG